ncbi:MAG: hypothetical protein M3394_01625 [Actinomycetota bacterium]|nr:hypothetical protein [Actinomycetota bacterium]
MTEPIVWLYQLSSKEWDQASYRLSVSEGERVAWPVGQMRSSREPLAGERIVCWWARKGAPEYGVIGWGVVEVTHYGSDIHWRPKPPSDRWAMAPINSPELDEAVKAVRGGMSRATLYVAEGTTAIDLIAAIRAADR